ncbi:hypothetical protein CK203_055116 [Vitis vinifera]|uniref:Integrase catalytic domain-containing protein n=1 Tax=Vitis vinifera TaxID=29760 RepID=A0A438GUE1_VITVI|nr:hypothetical protein CK203_055116 [Vitis vinifera]
MYFDGVANHSRSIDILPWTTLMSMRHVCILDLETALELGIKQMELLVERFDDLRYTHLPRVQNQFGDALATLASFVDFLTDVVIRPLLIELRSGTYLEVTIAKDRRTLRQLTTRFVICGVTLYRRSTDGMLLLCLDRDSADRMMREVHVGVCGPHIGGHMLAQMTKCQIHGDLIHAPPSELHALTSPWLFSKYDIRHHRSSAYRPQTNGAIEATNKNIKRILRRMVETSRDCQDRDRGLVGDPRGKFRPSWSRPYVIQKLTPEEAAWLIELEGNQFSEPTNVDQLKKYYV